MKLFIKHLRQYRDYAAYSAVASLRAEVSGSFLNWLWWILDPMLFMCVYSFISLVVFGRSEPHFIPFVFLGYGTWQFINRSIIGSVKMVRSNKGLLSRVYLPKYILLFSKLFRNLIQWFITFMLSISVSLIDHVKFSWTILFVPLILVVMLVLTFGNCCVMLHCGVYAQDLENVMTVVLKLTFYLTGIFYSLPKRIPAPYGKILLYVNPAAVMINELRNAVLYATVPNVPLLMFWFLFGIGVTIFGIKLIQNNEQTYVKAV